MKAFVTGGTGFVGSYLVKRLVEKNLYVRVFDNNLRGDINRLQTISKRIDFINGDITNYDEVYEATKNIDTIFHLAYINGTRNFYNYPEKVLEVGVKGALTTLDCALTHGVSNYIVTSSSEVYQEPTIYPTSENEDLNFIGILRKNLNKDRLKNYQQFNSSDFVDEIVSEIPPT